MSMIGASLSSIAAALAAQRGATPPPMPRYRPLIDPIALHEWWFLLLIPMAVFVAMTYKAVRLADMSRYWKQVLLMTAQIVVGLIALGAATYVLVFWVARTLAERAG